MISHWAEVPGHSGKAETKKDFLPVLRNGMVHGYPVLDSCPSELCEYMLLLFIFLL